MAEETRLLVRLRPSEIEPSALSAATQVRVTVEDVTMLDEPARTVADGTWSRSDVTGELTLDARLDPRRRYAVRVHVDGQGNGQVQAGDLMGAAAVPDERTAALAVDVRMTRVPDEPS